MKTSIERAWGAAIERADGAPPKDDGYLFFLLDETSNKKVYGGVDAERHLILAIEVSAQPATATLRSAALDYFRLRREGFDTWLMVLRLRRPDLAPVFGRLCQDLIDEIENTDDEETLIRLVHRRLSLWQRLFDQSGACCLDPQQVMGLLAELLYMDSVLSGGLRTASEIAASWVGPSGADQDFRFSAEAVEVKAVGPGARGVTISSLRQLDGLLPVTLSLWTLRPASADEKVAFTLNGLATSLEQRLASDPVALATFRESLLEVGYVTHPHYDDMAFEPLQTEQFMVEDEFPRLTTGEVPVGITSATYVLSLDFLRSRVAKSDGR